MRMDVFSRSHYSEGQTHAISYVDRIGPGKEVPRRTRSQLSTISSMNHFALAAISPTQPQPAVVGEAP